jgi:hypothetical protein
MTHTDLYGDRHEVTARVHAETGERSVNYDHDAYTPAQARALAADLIAAADTAERRLVAVAGGQEP